MGWAMAFDHAPIMTIVPMKTFHIMPDLILDAFIIKTPLPDLVTQRHHRSPGVSKLFTLPHAFCQVLIFLTD
jgi:hypothetical protein